MMAKITRTDPILTNIIFVITINVTRSPPSGYIPGQLPKTHRFLPIQQFQTRMRFGINLRTLLDLSNLRQRQQRLPERLPLRIDRHAAPRADIAMRLFVHPHDQALITPPPALNHTVRIPLAPPHRIRLGPPPRQILAVLVAQMVAIMVQAMEGCQRPTATTVVAAPDGFGYRGGLDSLARLDFVVAPGVALQVAKAGEHTVAAAWEVALETIAGGTGLR